MHVLYFKGYAVQNGSVVLVWTNDHHTFLKKLDIGRKGQMCFLIQTGYQFVSITDNILQHSYIDMYWRNVVWKYSEDLFMHPRIIKYFVHEGAFGIRQNIAMLTPGSW